MKSQKTNINSVPSSVQMGHIIYERNTGWVVWKLTNTKSGLKVAWGFNFLGKRLFLLVNMFYRIWDKPAGSKKRSKKINLTTTKTSLKRLKTETKILNCKAKAVIDNNFKFWNEERSQSLFRFRSIVTSSRHFQHR